VVVAGKHALPQWLTMEAAVIHCTEGIGIWQWACNDQGDEPDVVMACCGDTPTLEILAAVSILREHLPELKIRVVNVVDLMKLQSCSEHPLPHLSTRGAYLKQTLQDKLIDISTTYRNAARTCRKFGIGSGYRVRRRSKRRERRRKRRSCAGRVRYQILPPQSC
jgi:hypothetical protein